MCVTKNPSFRERECKDLSRSKEEAKCHYCIVRLAVFKVSVARFSIFNYHFWIVSRLLENGAPFPESCCSLFHLFSSWSSTRYCSSLTCRKKRTVIIIAANFLHNILQSCILFFFICKQSPLSPHSKEGIWGNGATLCTCLIISRCLLANVDVCSFKLLNWNDEDHQDWPDYEQSVTSNSHFVSTLPPPCRANPSI